MARTGDLIAGKYRLIHPLGIGGMGMVWRAEHVALKQQVALKLLHGRSAPSQHHIRRFQREAQIAASIRHRNIVYISDFGTDQDEPYLVMELLSGVPLSERMVVGEPLTVGTFMHLIDGVLQGLSAVHAAGVVHRDLKPENIFLVRESDGSLQPKLLDFGVSRSTDRDQGHTITREGFVMGTPEYVSPEQARGRMADVRSDIYSLGVVIFESLAGRLPFHADNRADLMVAVLNEKPLALSALRPELGASLSQLVGKAIERDPELRFQTADEMRAALVSLLETEPAHVVSLALPKRYLAPVSSDSMAPADAHSRESAPTAEESAEANQPTYILQTARSSRRGWLLASAGLSVALALGLLVAARGSSAGARGDGSSPVARAASAAAAPREVAVPGAPAAPIAVELTGVPSDALVEVDGVATTDSVLRFARGSGQHEIVVSAPNRLPFRVLHDATFDARYSVSLAPAKPAVKSARPAFTKPRKGLLRQADF